MIRLNELYNIAEKENIQIFSFALPLVSSVSMMDLKGNCSIGIDPFSIETYAEEKEHLAHELGHCITGSFYNIYSDCDVIAKAEYKADKWAIKKLIPEDEVRNAYEFGYTELWQLSELFGVPEEFMLKAVHYYKENAFNKIQKV